MPDTLSWNPDNGPHRLSGGGALLLYAQDKTWTFTLLACSQRVYVLRSTPEAIILQEFDLIKSIEGAEEAFGCIQERGTWHLISVQKGKEIIQYRFHLGPRIHVLEEEGTRKRFAGTLSVLSSGGGWSKRTCSGGRFIVAADSRFLEQRTSGGGVFAHSKHDQLLPAHLYEGTSMALEGAETERGVDIWTQKGEGGPIEWRWYDFRAKSAFLRKTVRVEEGEVLHDVHPTLRGIIIRGPYEGWRSWTPEPRCGEWGRSIRAGYTWRRLYPHPLVFPNISPTIFGVVMDSWGRRIVIRSASTPISFEDSWRPGRYVQRLERPSDPGEVILEVVG